MSALYGTISGDASRTDASRRGHRNITGHVRGWNVGVEVRGHLTADGEAMLEVYLTGGSNGGESPEHLGTAYIGAGGPTFRYTPGEVMPA